MNTVACACGNRPSVIVMSACYSGQFVEPLRGENRIIMTAARPDRTSFGCGADDEYTHYDRCLLRQFDGASTWRELAYATRACVERTERQLGMRASLPQIFVGTEVADLRLPGR